MSALCTPRAAARDDRGGRHERLSAADIPLQQPIHRRGFRHVVPDREDDAMLRRRRPEGQRTREALEQFRLRDEFGSPAARASLGTFVGRAERNREKLIEDQTFARGARGFGCCGTVCITPGVAQRPVTMRPQHGRRNVFAYERGEHFKISLDGRRDQTRRNVFRCAVDRNDRALVDFVPPRARDDATR